MPKHRKRQSSPNAERKVKYWDIQKQNEIFETYYKGQKIVPDGEWQSFMSTLRSDLPVCFRITGSRAHALAIQRIINNSFADSYRESLNKQPGNALNSGPSNDPNHDSSALRAPNDEGEVPEPEPPRALPWYPNNMVWQLNASRHVLRKFEKWQRFHQFLVAETDAGYINRQEAVSMIPPLLLDLQPHHVVLDMCAAPGSKTAQILELMHSRFEDANSGTQPSLLPTGMVVANDLEYKRCHLMMHQVKRLQSPLCVVLNHDATVFPNVLLPRNCSATLSPSSNADAGTSGSPQPSPATSAKPALEVLQYDRVLCDVPCSGDGTLRKNSDLWQRWSPWMALSLHCTQQRILRRAAELVRVGGRVVYSTCSMNPLEDEAVVAAVLQAAQGTLELIDCTNALPALRFVPGVHSWRVMTKDSIWYSKLEEVDPKFTQYRNIRESHFPPPPEIAAKLHLERCMRILPHLQNTGGFFVAVIEKREQVPWMRIVSAPSATCASEPSADGCASGLLDGQPPLAEDYPVDSAGALEPEPGEDVNDEQAASHDEEKNGNAGGKSTDRRLKRAQRKKKKLECDPTKKARPLEAPFVFLDPDRQDHQTTIADISMYYLGERTSSSCTSTPVPAAAPVVAAARGSHFPFPRELLFSRRESGPQRNVYLATQLAKLLVLHNPELRVVNTGVKVFSRSNDKDIRTNFRITQEGAALLRDCLPPRRLVHVSSADALVLLSEAFPWLEKLSPIAIQQYKAMEKGPCVVVCALSPNQVARTFPGAGAGCDIVASQPASQTAAPSSTSSSTDASAGDAGSDAAAAGPPLELVMCGWRGRGTLRLYMPRHERVHMLTLLGASEQLLNRVAKEDLEALEKEEAKARAKGVEAAAGAATVEKRSEKGSERGSRNCSRPESPTSSTGAAAGSDLEFNEQRQRELDADLDTAAGEPEPEQSDDEGVKGL